MGQIWLVSAGLAAALAFVAFILKGSKPNAVALTTETLLARTAQDAPDFLSGGPILHANDGALVALERTGARLALLLPQGTLHIVPANNARVEAAHPPILAVKTGDRTRPWVRADLPEGTPGTNLLRLLGGTAA